jgi:hypothetical protein
MRSDHNLWKRCHRTTVCNVNMMLADAQRAPRSGLLCWILWANCAMRAVSDSPVSFTSASARLIPAIDGGIGDSGQTHSQVGCRITVGQFSCSYQVRDIVLRDALSVRGRLLPQGVV